MIYIYPPCIVVWTLYSYKVHQSEHCEGVVDRGVGLKLMYAGYILYIINKRGLSFFFFSLVKCIIYFVNKNLLPNLTNLCYNQTKRSDRMKQLTIKLTDENELKISASEPLTPDTLIDLSLSACLAMMSSIVDEAPAEQKQKVKGYLFDLFNVSASALLSQFAPEIDLRPDLTEEAIMIKELELANDKLSDMRIANQEG